MLRILGLLTLCRIRVHIRTKHASVPELLTFGNEVEDLLELRLCNSLDLLAEHAWPCNSKYMHAQQRIWSAIQAYYISITNFRRGFVSPLKFVVFCNTASLALQPNVRQWKKKLWRLLVEVDSEELGLRSCSLVCMKERDMKTWSHGCMHFLGKYWDNFVYRRQINAFATSGQSHKLGSSYR